MPMLPQDDDINASIPAKQHRKRGGGAPVKAKGGLGKALYFHISAEQLARLDAYVARYSEKIKIKISRADVIRRIIDNELNFIDKKAAAEADRK